MRKKVVLEILCCFFVTFIFITEKGWADSIPLTREEAVLTSSDPDHQELISKRLPQGEMKGVLQTAAAAKHARSAPDPQSILLFGTGVVAWLMAMKMSKRA